MLKVENVRVVVDLGNSETRAYVIVGGGRDKFTLTNRFVELDSEYVIPDMYDESNSVVFSVPGIGRVAGGLLLEREFESRAMRPTAFEKKYEAITSRLSMNYVFLKAYEFLSQMYNVPIDEIDAEFNVTCMLPPVDIDFGKPKMIDLIKSIREINFEMPKVKKEIVVNDVAVLAEGFCAYIGTLMTNGMKVRQNFAYLVGKTTLVIDIGAGTTDFCIIKDNKVIEDTRDSFEIGGNNISQRVRKRLKAEGYSYTDTIIQGAIVSGFVSNGAKQMDIRKYINDAKSMTAEAIITDIKSFLESTQFPVRTIEYLLVCGGGSEDVSVDGLEPLSNYLVKYMKSLSENIELIPMPEITSSDGEKSIVSPRRLNIIGATLITEQLMGR